MLSVESFVGKALRTVASVGLIATPFILDGCTSIPTDAATKTIKFKPADVNGQAFLEISSLPPTLLRRLSDREIYFYRGEYSWRPNTAHLYNDSSLLPNKRNLWLMIDEKWEGNAGYQHAALSARLMVDGEAVNLFIGSAQVGRAKDMLGFLTPTKYEDLTMLTLNVDIGYAAYSIVGLNQKIWENGLQILLQKDGQSSQLYEIEPLLKPRLPSSETETLL